MKVSKSWNNVALNSSDIANPCGSIGKVFFYVAYTMFNDTFSLSLGTTNIAIN